MSKKPSEEKKPEKKTVMSNVVIHKVEKGNGVIHVSFILPSGKNWPSQLCLPLHAW
jgi:hypothetical protein